MKKKMTVNEMVQNLKDNIDFLKEVGGYMIAADLTGAFPITSQAASMALDKMVKDGLMTRRQAAPNKPYIYEVC